MPCPLQYHHKTHTHTHTPTCHLNSYHNSLLVEITVLKTALVIGILPHKHVVATSPVLGITDITGGPVRDCTRCLLV